MDYELSIYNVLYVIKEITGRKDLQVEKDNMGWRLTGLYADGKRASVGGLGVVSSAKDFYNKIQGFYCGLSAMKRWISVDLITI